MPAIERLAPAKVNLFLRILGRREDGYHDLESLVVPVSLADRLTFEPGSGGLQLEVTGPARAELRGDDPANLVRRAAEALADRCGREPEASVRLEKRIPVAAGLGGGSADAAATLVALNELWKCGLDHTELAQIGAAIGSDVPALLAGRPVLVRGRGEAVEPADVSSLWWTFLPGDVRVSTAEAYSWWDEDDEPPGADPGPFLEAIRRADPEEIGPLLYNDLEGPVFRRHPEVAAAKERLLEVGATGAVMAGSGGTVAGLARDGAHARRMAEALEGAIQVSGPG